MTPVSDSIRLVLWTGAAVPVPAPADVLAALRRVEVQQNTDREDGFQLQFSIAKDQPLDYGLLAGGTLDPFRRVVIGVLLGASPEVLIDGVITHHQVAPGEHAGTSTLTVMGRDVSVMLDLEEKNENYPNQADSVIVDRILSGYLQYGVTPDTTATSDTPTVTERTPRQQETDLRFLRRLAERNGFVFYIEPRAMGTSTAHWGAEDRLGQPQPALTVDMGAFTNVKRIDFSNDALAPVEARGSVLDPASRTNIPVRSTPSLRTPPLAASPVEARRTVIMRRSANESSGRASTSAAAAVTNAPEPVGGQGELETARYGNVLRARRLVGVRGAGRTYDGNYYVRAVTHTIERGAYTQRFTLSREGTGALSPMVRT